MLSPSFVNFEELPHSVEPPVIPTATAQDSPAGTTQLTVGLPPSRHLSTPTKARMLNLAPDPLLSNSGLEQFEGPGNLFEL
jgi:hypothetical protein